MSQESLVSQKVSFGALAPIWADADEPKQKVYIVGKWKDTKLWGVIGIFTDENVAVQHCLDYTYFVGPIDLDRCYDSFDSTPDDWEDMYYPMVN